MVETKGPPDTKYGRTVCRRAVSESLHRRFVYPTSEKGRKREGRRKERENNDRDDRDKKRRKSEESEAPS